MNKSQVLCSGKKKQIVTNVPTRWASNHFVMMSLIASQHALVAAVQLEAWANLPKKNDDDNKATVVRNIISSTEFWERMSMLTRLLQPFADAIHQVEADRPLLAHCHVVLLELQSHVQKWIELFHTGQNKCEITSFAEKTFMRRLVVSPSGGLAPVYNAAYSATYAIDPFFARHDPLTEGSYLPPVLSSTHKKHARDLFVRVGGARAGEQFDILNSEGYPTSMQTEVATLVRKREQSEKEREQHVEAGMRNVRVGLASAKARVRVWLDNGGTFPELKAVALRLLHCHATSAATERNWSLWGRVFTQARTALGMKRALGLIAICAAAKRISEKETMSITLDVIDDDECDGIEVE